MQDFAQASAYIHAIGAAGQIVDFRAIHDTNKAIPAIPFRDTLENAWSSIVHYNNQGYGIFAVVNQLDGHGREIANVTAIRAHFIDLDNLSAQQNYERASIWTPAPSFAVQSSPGKYHVYWPVVPYAGNDFYTLHQRKLRQLFDGDKTIIDPTRVMRLPGTTHAKGTPHLVTCHSLAGYGSTITAEAMQAALVHVNVIDAGAGGRHELGDPALTAPSLAWVQYALDNSDPNGMARGDWISFTAAIKQSAWLHGTPEAIFDMWSAWCAKYDGNDPGENRKQWDDLKQTQVGWSSVLRRIPTILAMQKFRGETYGTKPGDPLPQHPAPKPEDGETPAPTPPPMPTPSGGDTVPPMPEPQQGPDAGEFMDAAQQARHFAGCVSVTTFGEILTPSGRFLGPGAFALEYSGYKFIIDATGKVTDDPWKAATRSTQWRIPKVDHIRFLPEEPQGAIVLDQLGRRGVNTYIPIKMKFKDGDASPFLDHIKLMIPNDTDRENFLAYLAHNVKFPGVKIRWAPMIQSTEGVGKGIIMEMMERIIGEMYCYSPKAQDLTSSGSTFNAWMRSKLMIIVNEIKTDEKRELVEILKPMITDPRIEVQSKGVDQEMEDNPANWLFFSNWKDAVPIKKNGRRWAIMYSAIQSTEDLMAAGMDDDYFNRLFAWMRADGAAITANWFRNHPVTKDTMPGRAPITSSMDEALRQSRGPVENIVIHAIEDALPGFRGGWVSVQAVLARIKALGAKMPAERTVTAILEDLGYVYVGRSLRPYFQENREEKSLLYAKSASAPVEWYEGWQGYGAA